MAIVTCTAELFKIPVNNLLTAEQRNIATAVHNACICNGLLAMAVIRAVEAFIFLTHMLTR